MRLKTRRFLAILGWHSWLAFLVAIVSTNVTI